MPREPFHNEPVTLGKRSEKPISESDNCSTTDVAELSLNEIGEYGCITAEERGIDESPENKFRLVFLIKRVGTVRFKKTLPRCQALKSKIQNHEIRSAARSQRCPGSCSPSRPLQAGLVLYMYV